MLADSGIQDKKHPVGSWEKTKDLLRQSGSEQRDAGPTEKDNPHSANIDSLSAFKIAQIINRQDQKIALAVRSQLKTIALAMAMVQEALERGEGFFMSGQEPAGGWAYWTPRNARPPLVFP